jgi:hypothetical protein
MWQISYPPANGASLGRYLKTHKFCIKKKWQKGLMETALAAKLANF